MTPQVENKLERVKEILRRAGSCAVAYSGGVDSSLLLAIAREVLGDRAMAVIAAFPFHSRREIEEALTWVKGQDIPVELVKSDELDIPYFRENPPDRCYHCKKAMLDRIREGAAARGFDRVVDGTNADDTEAGVAFAWYFCGQNQKLQLDLRDLEFAGLIQASPRIDRKEGRLQFQLIF